MIENRQPGSASFDPIHIDCAEAPWVEVRGKRILIAEDEESLRGYLRTLLELEGHHVTEAGNGAEALHAFTSGHFDLVITDFEMPVMSGDLLAAGIKLLAPSLPILMITGCAMARVDAENPVDALLSKPFTVNDFHCALRKLLSVPLEPAQQRVCPDALPNRALVGLGQTEEADLTTAGQDIGQRVAQPQAEVLVER